MAAKILCVEDYEPTRAVMSAALREFELTFAASGRDALVQLNSTAFDALILDVWLPDYDGISLCRDIRRDDPHVPIICWTVAHRDETRERALRAGVDVYLEKSPDSELLRDTTARLVRAAAGRFGQAAEKSGASPARAGANLHGASSS